MSKDYKLKRNFRPLGELLADGRERANLTQREAAAALGYASPQFISNFERGIAAPPLAKMKILVKLYSLNITRVLDTLFACERARMMEVLEGKPRRSPRGGK